LSKAKARGAGGKQWTAAGAARFAREARAQTVLHLAKAHTPVQWQVYGLSAGLDMWRRMYGSRRLAAEVLLGPIGYPPPYKGSIDEYAQQITRDCAKATAAASLFVVSPTMHDVVVAAALSLSIDDLNRVDEADPPTPAGLVVLPHAMLQVDAAGDTADVRALLWSPITIYSPDSEPRPGLRVTVFLDAHGPVRVPTFDTFAEQARLRGEPLPPLVFDAIQGLPFHYDKPVAPLVLAERAIHLREQAERGRRAAEQAGHDSSATVGEYTSGAPVNDPDQTLSRRYLFAFWRLCEQRIGEVTPAPIPHSATATAARAGTSPQASVVTLRQQVRAAGQPAQARPVHWTARWVVRMHKVEQWYPRLNTHRILWRGPFLKGPDGLPIKAPAVSALVR
jgi:hypothetical protein